MSGWHALTRGRGMSPFKAGLIAIVAIVIGVYFAFARGLPFGDHYELKIHFDESVNVKERQPVRIAGVDVGKVVKVEHADPPKRLVEVTVRIDDEGRPVHEDAQVKIRPRMFLEGNWFLEMSPGTDGSPELKDGGTIPVHRTSSPVQLGQVFSILQSDTRQNIRRIFREYGSALEGEGARGFNRSIPYWEPAYRNSAIVQDATLGLNPHDLSDYIDSAGRVARGLDRSPTALKSLITDFDTAAGAFAREATSLETAIEELPRTLAAARPALAKLNDAFPPLRRLTADLRPSVRETGRTIDVSFPFIQQTRRLVSRAELRGLVADLRPTVPNLARLTRDTVPLFETLRESAGCENEVFDHFSNDRLEDPFFPATGKIYEEAPKPLPSLAAESRNGDANGQWFHVLVSAGDYTVNIGDDINGNPQFAQAYFPVLGSIPPSPPKGYRPPLRPEVPCETQEPPDLRVNPGPGDPVVAKGLPSTPKARAAHERAKNRAVRFLRRDLERLDLDEQYRVSPKEIGR
jgi:phospholipid/cholesterol/gamma-HCH transport system substrate-binding protein